MHLGCSLGAGRVHLYQSRSQHFRVYLDENPFIAYKGEHIFRHTFATNCYYKGMDVKILSKLLGHADVNITYNIYVHLYGDGFDEMYSALVK